MNKKGFTLIELLVVIVILAIIALITVPNALAMITTAQTRADQRTTEGVRRAAEVYCLSVRTASPTASVPANGATTAANLSVTNAIVSVSGVNFDSACSVTAGTVTIRTGVTYNLVTGLAV